jgi:APA family basic amino acid/polyamine antiporter
VVPLIFLLASVFLLGNYLVSRPVVFLLDVLVILSGWPVYAAWRRWAR